MKRRALPLIVVCSLAMLYAAAPAIAQPADQTVNNLTVNGNADVGGHVGVGGYEETQYLLTQIFSSGASKSNLGLFDTRPMAEGVGGQLMFGGKYTTGNAYERFAMIVGGKKDSTSGDYDGVLQFFVRNGSFAEAMRIDSDGNVGIGTPAPNRLLTVGAAMATTNLAPQVTVSTAGLKPLFVGDTGTSKGMMIGYGGNDIQGRTGTNFGDNGNLIVNPYGGNVGIGIANPTSRLHVVGAIHSTLDITSDGVIRAKFQDIAEWVPATEAIEAGTVVVVAPLNHVSASREAYDTRVAGVVSAQPGLILGEEGDSKVMVATTGRVKVRVDASNGAIREGDILVSSGIRGTAMKSEPLILSGRKFHQPGTVIGKALEPLEKGSGEILVLLSMQ